MTTQPIKVMEGPWDPMVVIRDIVASGDQEDPLYILDIGDVVASYYKWKEVMPDVQPFYAVKCNPDKILLKTLAEIGAGFDCASKVEIEQVLTLGVNPERIIFANPAKTASHIRFSAEVGVELMTFDSEFELIKIKSLAPDAQLVIRIRCDAEDADISFGDKFGCDVETEAPRFLKLAASLQIAVVGVSFHVGSGTRDLEAYGRGIQLARQVFDVGTSMGHCMTLLDIGGGFLGARSGSIGTVASIVNNAISNHFQDRYVKVIAEPGTYFAKSAYTLAVQVHAKRKILKTKNGETDAQVMYYINDGLYGSFADSKYGVKYNLEPLKPSSEKLQRCTIWGPTCDALDYISRSYHLPPLSIGDWLVVRNMGAYTLALATAFNGFPTPRVHPVVDKKTWLTLENLSPFQKCDLENAIRKYDEDSIDGKNSSLASIFLLRASCS